MIIPAGASLLVPLPTAFILSRVHALPLSRHTLLPLSEDTSFPVRFNTIAHTDATATELSSVLTGCSMVPTCCLSPW